MSATDAGGEPWWVVVATMVDRGVHDREYASTAVDAPDAETAEAEGQRVIVANERREPEKIARVTGPFPNHVPTEGRERRPKMCQGCGLERYCGNHAPTPHQTWWTKVDDQSSEDEICWKCVQCGTLTYIAEDFVKLVEEGDSP